MENLASGADEEFKKGLRASTNLNDSSSSGDEGSMVNTSMDSFANNKPKMQKNERVFNLNGQGKPLSLLEDDFWKVVYQNILA